MRGTGSRTHPTSILIQMIGSCLFVCLVLSVRLVMIWPRFEVLFYMKIADGANRPLSTAPHYLLIGQSTLSEKSKALPDWVRVAPTPFSEMVLYKVPIQGKPYFQFFTFDGSRFPDAIMTREPSTFLSSLRFYKL